MDETFETFDTDDDHVEQLQPGETLVDRGVADVLDEGYIAPDGWSPAQGFGNTPEEMRQGETLEQRIRQEIPEPVPDVENWNPNNEKREVGAERAGRLMHVQGSGREDTLGVDVGISGGAASAEEAAMHIISDDQSDDDIIE